MLSRTTKALEVQFLYPDGSVLSNISEIIEVERVLRRVVIGQQHETDDDQPTQHGTSQEPALSLW